MNHIELFAGCGGLNLGLMDSGFKLLMANEISPMAAETFSFNFFDENLLESPQTSEHTLWISSNFPREEMNRRLREDPRTYPDKGGFCDLYENGKNLKGSLVVGSIITLNGWLKKNPEALARIKDGFGSGGVDLISGGPPCQSFSLAGLREKNNEKNHLPWAFAEFAKMVQPKVVLLENVSGILRPFVERGTKYYAWFEVAKTFVDIGYIPLTLHINAKFVGVAQNRPRFILIGVREDLFPKLKDTMNAEERRLFASSEMFFAKVRGGAIVSVEDLTVHDLNSGDRTVQEEFTKSFFSPLFRHKAKFVSVAEAIGDLGEDRADASAFVRKLNKRFNHYLRHSWKFDWSHRIILNQDRVKRRFRLYQVLEKVDCYVKRDIGAVLSGKKTEISDTSWQSLKNYEFLQEDGNFSMFRSKESFEAFLMHHLTKKQIQRALVAEDPAPAALSIPDDACHYQELRTLTAREMARIQSFPDNFAFRSKMTTGGQSRRFEVPIYTQIGNAVPVLLGQALGECVKALITRL